MLLVVIAAVLLLGHDAAGGGAPPLDGVLLAVAGVVAGFAIGVVASLLGVAGGELLIPTLVLLFGADIKLAGSLSLAVSLPTMLVGFARYSRDRSFAVLGRNRAFVLVMAAGSVVGHLHRRPDARPRPELRAPAAARRDPARLGREGLATRARVGSRSLMISAYHRTC